MVKRILVLLLIAGFMATAGFGAATRSASADDGHDRDGHDSRCDADFGDFKKGRDGHNMFDDHDGRMHNAFDCVQHFDRHDFDFNKHDDHNNVVFRPVNVNVTTVNVITNINVVNVPIVASVRGVVIVNGISVAFCINLMPNNSTWTSFGSDGGWTGTPGQNGIFSANLDSGRLIGGWMNGNSNVILVGSDWSTLGWGTMFLSNLAC